MYTNDLPQSLKPDLEFYLGANAHESTTSVLRFITCGSVDDGKSTLIGRLLLDSKAVLQDQLDSVRQKSLHNTDSDALDLAMFTDGLSAEREQGITIDVAYRYFATPRRKFIIGDAPGHEQYTRNMVTAASSADAAVVLVDATKLPRTHTPMHAEACNASILLPQTRRHALLVQLLRVPHIVFAINKLDAVADPTLVFAQIRHALQDFAEQANISTTAAIIPISALHGNHVVYPDTTGLAGYRGPSLLEVLEKLPAASEDTLEQFVLPVQWVEKHCTSSDTSAGRRIFWGRITAGSVQVGQMVSTHPSGLNAKVTKVFDHCRNALQEGKSIGTGASVGIVLEHELDISRGDYLLGTDESGTDANVPARKRFHATLAWLGNDPLIPGRTYHALHGHKWVKAKVERIVHALNIQTLQAQSASALGPNAIGEVVLQLQEALPLVPYAASRRQGALILADTASNNTVAAVLVQ